MQLQYQIAKCLIKLQKLPDRERKGKLTLQCNLKHLNHLIHFMILCHNFIITQ